MPAIFPFLALAFGLLSLSQRGHAEKPPVASPTASSPTVPSGAQTTLQPVLPPSGNANGLDALSPNANLTLWWGGVSGGSLSKRSKSNGGSGILANVAFEFGFPSVALDHSSEIADIVCSDNSTLTGVFNSSSAYGFAQSAWSGLDQIVFITSATSCGGTDQNDAFLAQNITFSEDKLSFTATGAEYSLRELATKSTISFGNASPSKLRKRSYQGNVAHTSDRARRQTICFFSCYFAGSDSLNLDYLLSDQSGFSIDSSAPWDDAVLLASFQNSGGDSGGEGSPDRRSLEPAGLNERDLSSGLNLYCVGCGIDGSLIATGTIGTDFGRFSVAQIALTGQMWASVALGIDANTMLSENWSNLLFQEPIGAFTINGIVDVTPYIEMAASATLAVYAEGQLLLGVNATWDNVDILMDYIIPTTSYANGLTPTLNTVAQAEAQVAANLTFALPFTVGVGINVPDLFPISAAVTDTPSITGGASFSASNDATDAGSCNGGIDWFLEFDNNVDLTVTNVISNYSLASYDDPLAGGCLPLIGGSSSSTGSNTGDGTSGVSCAGGLPAVSAPGGSGPVCGYLAHRQPGSTLAKVGRQTLDGAAACAAACLANAQCLSMSYTAEKNSCHLYAGAVSDMVLVAGTSEGRHMFYDAACWANCPSVTR